MKSPIILLTALIATFVCGQDKVPGNNPLQYCPSHSDNVHISNVNFDPNPPQKGQKLTISANGTATKPVQRGQSIDLKVSWGWLTVIHKKIDVCQQLQENFDVECPSKEFHIVKEFDLPSGIPSGHYKLVADGGAGLTCLQSVLVF